ncbi:M16 family metallopeptidase [Haloferula sp. BvORR071]|uniref:M16 family metallopeptidase n=1 Tax=Haloferula sp. BvORR071 TaxID=1396141 RepID=UPI000697F534|nr:M16 family metallopeptidase [Haloferula sp. BvORR071]
MRNPAPIILSLLLAAVAAFFLITKPQPATVTVTPPQAPPADAKTTAATPGTAAPVVEKAAPITPPVPVKTDVSVPEGDAKVWPQEKSDIKADPKAVFGKLENGMRYMIYPNAEPPGRVSLRMHIATGSLMEADDQQGLAHFLEHMVFNGTKHFTPDDLIPKMQHLGIGFGAHVNAYTSFDETVYMLDLPNLSQDTLDLGFTVMRDFGDGAKLDIEEIDKERGVILSEKTTRDSVKMRIMLKQFSELLPDSLIPKRFPIGEEEVISKATRDRFVDYYTRFYTPQRMTFIVVGDVKPEEVEARIKESFSSMANPADPGKNPDLGKITPIEGVKAAVFADKEVDSTSLSLVSVRPFSPVADTTTRRLSLLPLELAHAAIARRFERIAKQDGSPITAGSASREELFNTAELGSFDVEVADDRWQEALPVMEQEYRRALEFGFTEPEIAEAKANVLNAYQQAVKTAASRKSEALASGLARSINEGSVFSTPETDLQIISGGLDSATPDACHAAFREFWADRGFHLILTTKDEPADAVTTLSSLYKESHDKAVEAPEQKKSVPFAYSEFGTPGKVKSRKDIADPALSQLMLSNGVRLNFKKTDFEKGSIRLLARIGSGKLTQPKDSPGIDFFASSVFDAGGLGKHSVDDLQQILAGRNVGTNFGITDDAFILSGRTTPEDLELELQLMCAQMTDPGYREEALVEFRKSISAMFQQVRHTVAGAQVELEAYLHGGDFRWTLPEESKLASYTLEDARKWLTPALNKGYLELSIVGDFDESRMLPMILKTFGALAQRETEKPALPAQRKVSFPKAPAEKSFAYDSKIPQATAHVVWKTEGLRNNTKFVRRLNLLGEVLSDRLRKEIREKMGASYSPGANPDGSDGLEGFGYLISDAVGKPEDVKKLTDVTATLGAELAEKGLDDDELDRARKPLLAQIEKSKRDNTYWLGNVLAKSQENPEGIELVRGRDADVASITPKELGDIAKKYLGEKNAIKVQLRSEAK